MSRKHRLQENVFISSGKQDVGCQAVQGIVFKPSESPEMRGPKSCQLSVKPRVVIRIMSGYHAGLVILGKHQEVRKQKRERLWYSISPSLVRALRVKPAEHQHPIDSNKSHYLSLAGLPSAGARMAGCLRFP